MFTLRTYLLEYGESKSLGVRFCGRRRVGREGSMSTPPEALDVEREGGSPGAHMPPWIPRLLLTVIVYVLGAFLLFQAVLRVRSLLFMVVVSLFLSFAIEPAVNFLAQQGWRRGAATGFILFGVILIGIVLLVSMIPLLIDQIQGLVAEIPSWLDTISEKANDWFGIDLSVADAATQAEDYESALRTYGADVAGNLLGFGAAVISGLFQLFTILLFTFYLVADGPKVRRSVCSLLPPRRQREVLQTWEIAIDKSGAYFYSRMLLALINGGLLYGLLRVMGVPFALPLALWSGLFSQFVPVVGTYIASILPILVALLNDPFDALVVLVYILIYQQVENYALSPRITKHTMQLHPAVAIGSAIAGGSLAGPIGAFLSLPAAAIIQASIGTFVQRHEVLESELTTESDPEAVRAANKEAREKRRNRPAATG
jgi:predicted PurR-regulated permease PerM